MFDYQLVICDWQGTLTDVRGQFCHQFKQVASQLGLELADEDALETQVGHDLMYIIQQQFDGLSTHKQTAMLELFQHHYIHHQHDVCLYDDVKDFMTYLINQHRFIAIATSASSAALQQELTYSQLAPFIDATRSADQTINKPAPDMLLELMDELACQPAQTVMIGDSEVDLDASLNAGVDFIGIHIDDANLKQRIQDHGGRVVASFKELTEI